MKVLVYPNGIAGGQRLMHYKNNIGFEWTNDPLEEVDLVHYYDYRNRVDGLPSELTPHVNNGVHVINKNLLSIMKDDIDRVASSIFGYSIMVDPTTFRGSCVLNTTQNAVKIARIIQCPISEFEVDTAIRPSKTGVPHRRLYMKLIDTRISHDTIRDYRFVVMGYQPVLLYEKHIDVKATFFPKKGDTKIVYAHHDFSDHFTDQEINDIKRFIHEFNFEWGEIDVLRSNYDGRIYIIDCNDIPAGPIFNNLSNGDEVRDYLSQTYKALYL